ncbi:MAG: isochorismatase family protein [Thermoplasmata archaeon]|nr:MAG: isochorismatase family protein [Thermoplasmata archaeon]
MIKHTKVSEEEDYITKETLELKARSWYEEVKEYVRKGFSLEPTSSVLLVIDMQRFFADEQSHAFLPAARAIVPNIKRLIAVYRACAQPVIFTRHALLDSEDPGIMGEWWADVLREKSPMSDILPALSPLPSDTVIRKTRYNAFWGTELGDILAQMGVKSVVITGVMTHLCCETTAREAFIRDFEVYFVVDGTATQDEEFHVSSIRNLAHGFAIPVTTSMIMDAFEGMRN